MQQSNKETVTNNLFYYLFIDCVLVSVHVSVGVLDVAQISDEER